MIRPQPRPEVFDIYWKFAYERHRIFEARVAGRQGPWTDDPILRTYKFCNVYRAADRVSQYLIREICYADDSDSPEDRIFQITAFRTFSNIHTWESLKGILGRNPRVADLRSGTLESALNETKKTNGGLYTGAFILCATNAYGRGLKHLNHVDLFSDMFLKKDLASKILAATTLKNIYDLLHKFPLMGDFMSYQTAIDLNYSSLVNFSENDFTQPGPGALRGIAKTFSSTNGLSPSDIIMWMVEHQEEEFDRLGLEFTGLWGRPIQAIDAQNLFCETDKYCREAVPSLASARTRIKTKYRQTTQPIRLFFPPKWGINHLLPKDPVFNPRAPLREFALA
ncbi:nucleotide kinase domain-containing protein [Paenarthrobacter nicotinovorans]|uniref:Nucleotide kinase domain-containing protein n=1 Tax=Paenarthrobacter nicotinovorans TaxID=29320 RepID=A0ABV0GTA5_PAENI